MRKLQENLVILLVAQVAFLTSPAIVHAESPNYNPINFTQPLSVVRGKIIQNSPEAFYLNDEETCNLVVVEFGWQRSACESIDRMIIGYTADIDNIMFEKPVSDGFVSLDDWEASDVESEIAKITDELKHSIERQGERLQQSITFEGWLVYPTVDRARNALYYANVINWDGQPNINVSISLFDRQGYIPVDIVTADSSLSPDEIERVVASVVAGYQSDAGQSYSEWTSGDKVASYGALGVFAGMLGLKYSKAATAGIMAIAVVFLKKFWFVLLLPLAGIKSIFRRKPKG